MKGTCELRALEPVPGSAHADGGPAGAACTKCRGLSAGEANAGAVLIEERAATLTQFLLAGLVLQSGEEADGRRLSPPGLPAMPLSTGHKQPIKNSKQTESPLDAANAWFDSTRLRALCRVLSAILPAWVAYSNRSQRIHNQ